MPQKNTGVRVASRNLTVSRGPRLVASRAIVDAFDLLTRRIRRTRRRCSRSVLHLCRATVCLQGVSVTLSAGRRQEERASVQAKPRRRRRWGGDVTPKRGDVKPKRGDVKPKRGAWKKKDGPVRVHRLAPLPRTATLLA